jgi:hypothetical protein
MQRNALLGIAFGLALVMGACGGGNDEKQQDAAPQQDVVQFDRNLTQDDAAPDGPVGNHTFETAKPIALDSTTYTDGTLTNPLTSKDYYKFDGTAGQRIAIATIAKGEQTDTFDPAYLDLVVTLYDSSQTAIATQDDPWPRSSNDPQLYVVLPSAGTYYVEVVECNLAYGSASCSPATDITVKTYQVAIFTVDTLGPPFPALEGVTDQDGTTANAIAVPFNSAATYDAGVGGNQYYRDVLGGGFQAASDIDVFNVKFPADYLILEPTYRATASFYLQVPGATSGNGSTANMKMWLVDANDSSGKYVAMLDQTNYGVDFSGTNGPAELSVPVTFNNQYYLYVQNGGTAGAHDFYYVVRDDDNYFGPFETADSTNNVLSTPETMATQQDADGSDWYGVSGNITAGDVDHYVFATNTGLTSVNVRCDAMRIGSGLRGFKASLLKTDGTAVSGGSATEVVGEDLFLQGVAVPSGVTQLILKVEATSTQDTNITSNHYRCQIHVFTPTA